MGLTLFICLGRSTILFDYLLALLCQECSSAIVARHMHAILNSGISSLLRVTLNARAMRRLRTTNAQRTLSEQVAQNRVHRVAR